MRTAFRLQQELALLKRMFSLASGATPPKAIFRCRDATTCVKASSSTRHTQLLAALPEYLRPVVTMAYCTGMRRGEIADATVAVLGLAGIETDQPIGDFRKVWDSACAKSGLTGRLFHDLRRSAVRALIRSGVQERVAMMILGHKTRSVFDRYNIVSEQDLTDAVRKLQRFQDAGQPAGQPAQAASSTPADRPAFVN